MPVHLVGISGGRVWHTIRNPNAWSPWDDVFGSAGTPAGTPRSLAAGFVMGSLHVCLLTQSGLFTPSDSEAGAGNLGGTRVRRRSLRYPESTALTAPGCGAVDAYDPVP
jgi:hypothetical protein